MAKELAAFCSTAAGASVEQSSKSIAAAECFSFCAFCLCCSGVYVLNDLLDLSADRNHPQKRLRPFASGLLPIIAGVGLAPLLIGLSLGLSMWLLSPFFVITLMLYLTTAFAYSAGLKRFPILDVLLLAGLYFCGSWQVRYNGDNFSQWLIAFSIFFFFHLALSFKRWSELKVLSASGKTAALGRGYLAADGHFLQAIGIVSGYLSVLVLSLYMNSREVTALYRPCRLPMADLPITSVLDYPCLVHSTS